MRDRTPHKQWNDTGQRVPVRTCVACRSRRPQAHLLRIARAQGVLQPDPGRHIAGRGWYVCNDQAECWRIKALGRLARAEAPALAEAILALRSAPQPPA